KSAGLAVTFVIVSKVSPVFVSFTSCGRPEVPTYWFGKVTFGGDKLTPLTPVPVKGTVCGLPGALSATASEAVAFPNAVGLKVTLMLQLPFGVSDDGQLLVWPNSLLLAPAMPIDVMVRVPGPVLVRVVTCGLVVVPAV